MKILIAGGSALGCQALRLAEAAGMHTLLADKNPACPGAAMADEFFCLDITKSPLPEADYVLPATESDAALAALSGENVLFDAGAWKLTASRLASDAFLRENRILVPAYFPDGSEPYLVKPDRGSFGRGIWVTEDFCEVGGAVNAGFVAQEELPGAVWSQVVIANRDGCTAYPPARLTFDSLRRRTGAVCDAAPEAQALAGTAETIARAMNLHGILEVEAIFHRGVWKVIDLNARLPLFTPDAILAASGTNLLCELI